MSKKDGTLILLSFIENTIIKTLKGMKMKKEEVNRFWKLYHMYFKEGIKDHAQY